MYSVPGIGKPGGHWLRESARAIAIIDAHPGQRCWSRTGGRGSLPAVGKATGSVQASRAQGSAPPRTIRGPTCSTCFPPQPSLKRGEPIPNSPPTPSWNMGETSGQLRTPWLRERGRETTPQTLYGESVPRNPLDTLLPACVLPQLISDADHDLAHISQLVGLDFPAKASQMNLTADASI